MAPKEAIASEGSTKCFLAEALILLRDLGFESQAGSSSIMYSFFRALRYEISVGSENPFIEPSSEVSFCRVLFVTKLILFRASE